MGSPITTVLRRGNSQWISIFRWYYISIQNHYLWQNTERLRVKRVQQYHFMCWEY